MKRAILRLLTREYDDGIIAREIIKQRHEPGQIRVKVKVKNGTTRRLAQACAVVKLEEIRAEEWRYLQEQASQLAVAAVSDELYSVHNPESGSRYQVRRVVSGDSVIWDCNCLHFEKMGRRDCKHAIAAEMKDRGHGS
ncbi:MAG: SWIM zinc finger family protein [Cyanobacteria bacterium P01_F01_bin.42]